MAARIVKVDPFDLVVFGGTGDLAYRKLYPALFHREKSGQFTEPTRIIGVSRRRSRSRRVPRRASRTRWCKFNAVDARSAADLERFLARLDYVAADATSDAGWADLKDLLGPDERIRAFYLATGPDLFCPIAKRLGAEGLATPARASSSRSRSATTARAPTRSTTTSARSSPRARSSASTTISARRRCRT